VKQVKNIVKVTNGHKTEGAGLLMVIFQILMLYKPELVNPTTEKAINIGISSGAVGAIAHRFWRNRKLIIEWVKSLVKRK